jgi:hypothetical protein
MDDATLLKRHAKRIRELEHDIKVIQSYFQQKLTLSTRFFSGCYSAEREKPAPGTRSGKTQEYVSCLTSFNTPGETLVKFNQTGNLTLFFKLEKQRALRRRTWGGPALERPAECKDLGLHSGELCVNS